ncbi:Gfo/Idh/MocA family oxidoreductase [Telmatocola sphagniphila]|uniref:Gfo/Idh/MocA family oxidoreductase n=1 Tax=Telmatocola sphagniphila TaxID=1123043 RepID=A0A8E6B9Y8_9BACT|nr:Gfo/Idh/MocA family oxidoreductase [Telmatocola sphagniphila]QVL34528.1 Gfo/Idh/MocA family oxidoreductase [Telmatocola sphagniphila]
MEYSPNRRHFILSAGLGTAALAMNSTPTYASKSNEIRIGVIGTANQARANWEPVAAAGGKIVTVCDVDENLAVDIRKKHPDAKFFSDYRKLLEAKGIDAVIVSTADHNHFPATYLAIQAGLHVYCEKPLTHTVGEARRIIEATRQKKVVTQMGTQIHAGKNYRRVVEILQSGAIGEINEVQTWVGTSYGKQSLKARVGNPSDKIPAGFNYDLWLGPVAERPYSSAYHPFNWRHFWAFGGGALADMACHHMDLPFWALGLKHPSTVSAKGSPVDPEICHEWCDVEYIFLRENKEPLKLTWSDGPRNQTLVKELGLQNYAGGGNLFIGKKGMLVANYGSYTLLPKEQFKDFKAPAPTIPDSIGHHKEWLEAIRKRTSTTCNFEYSGTLTEAVLLGTVAYRTGKKLEWDAKNLKATNVSEADKLIHKEYRKGWAV